MTFWGGGIELEHNRDLVSDRGGEGSVAQRNEFKLFGGSSLVSVIEDFHFIPNRTILLIAKLNLIYPLKIESSLKFTVFESNNMSNDQRIYVNVPASFQSSLRLDGSTP